MFSSLEQGKRQKREKGGGQLEEALSQGVKEQNPTSWVIPGTGIEHITAVIMKACDQSNASH